MVYIPPAGGGESSGTIAVDTTALKVTAPTFRQVGQQVTTVQQTVQNSVQMGSGELFLVLEFSKLASLLEALQSHITLAMQCAAGGLIRIGTSLIIAADLYEENENVLGSTFTQLQDDPIPWHLALPFVQGGIPLNPGRTPMQPTPTPTPQPDPGLKPQQPAPNPWPVPGINPGSEPEVS